MKRNTYYMIAVSIVLSFLCLSRSNAQDYNDALRLSSLGFSYNARAMGMGDAYLGLSDDFSAVSFNPAGLGLVKRMEFAGGLHYNKYNNNTTFFNNETNYSNSATKLDQLSFVFPFPTMRGSFVVAIGYSRDRDFNSALSFDGFNIGNNSMIRDLSLKNDVLPYKTYLSYPLYNSSGSYINDTTLINGNLNQSADILSSGGIGKWSFAGAAEVSKGVFIGGTLNIFNGSFKRTRDYYEDDTKDVYNKNIMLDPGNTSTADFKSFYLNDVIDWDISGWDAKVGVLYQLYSSIKFGARIGATIKLPTSYTIKETYTVDAQSEFGTGKTYPLNEPLESKSEYDITTPFVFSGGASVNYAGLILNGDISYIDYSQLEFSNGLSESKINSINKSIKNMLTGVINLNAGAEYTIPEVGIRLRGGFIINPSPFKDDPSERDKKFITAGIGFLTQETFAVDAAYVYGWWKDIGDNYGTNVSRTYQDIKYHNMVLTFSYRF